MEAGCSKTEGAAASTSLGDMMQQLRKCQWYYGSISSRKAERLLQGRTAGSFLLRDSRSECYLFTISYTSENGVYHTRVQYHSGRFCLGGPNALLCANNLMEFVEKAVESSKSTQNFDILMHPSRQINSSSHVHFLYPVQRSHFLPSLKKLCRILIRQNLTDEFLINKLPLPRRLKKYLAASDFLYPL